MTSATARINQARRKAEPMPTPTKIAQAHVLAGRALYLSALYDAHAFIIPDHNVVLCGPIGADGAPESDESAESRDESRDRLGWEAGRVAMEISLGVDGPWTHDAFYSEIAGYMRRHWGAVMAAVDVVLTHPNKVVFFGVGDDNGDVSEPPAEDYDN